MNPLILFDYVYYSIAYLYSNRWGYKVQKEFIGVSILSLIQFLNIVTLIGFFNISLFELTELNPLLITFSSFFIIIILNIIRYKKIITYSELSNKWDIENNNSIFIKKAGVILYLILTCVLLFISASIN